MILNNDIVAQWKRSMSDTNRPINPIVGPPPEGMFHQQYIGAPTDIVLGFRTVDGDDSILYEFSQNTWYFQPIVGM